ncbi:YidC/Oxa1 family insertase periplasmic-domain containing protein [Mucisphaera calidilacus]|uniref:Membrane protein insertase YidC n=1 Tax=Mucisphaera calidilacus TaxID=2527982 RepID=A0A518BVH3_9BACT|nr:YidC/Oxa1 family insertase periplasmic-domain containing protein [Mucisphaera calidilacus]QDU70983.1 Membrane protein insertase YidC [Mucisphaera calidilacus]
MRILIPLVAVVLGLVVAFGMLNRSAEISEQLPNEPSVASQAETSADEAAQPADTSTTDAPPVTTAQPEVSTPAETLDTPPVVLPSDNPTSVTLGSTNEDDGYKFEIQLSRWGAGVSQIALTDYNDTLDNPVPYIVHSSLTAPVPGSVEQNYLVRPYAARALRVGGQTVDLLNASWSLVASDTDFATYTAIIATSDEESAQPLVAVERTFRITPGSYDITVEQRIRNLSDRELDISWTQFLQGDTPRDKASYLGDRRYFVPGYFNLEYDPNKVNIYTDDAFFSRPESIAQPKLWPHPDLPGNLALAWIAAENRYFALVTHLPVTNDLTSTAQVQPLQKLFPSLDLYVLPTQPIADEHRLAVITATTATLRLPANGQRDLDFAVYAGPRKTEIFNEAPYNLLHLDKTIRYSLGGLIDVCTWQFLARWLLAFLGFFHWLLADWGVAIIVLVVTVRLILHPIMKKSQLSMMRMGKVMQKLQPEIEKLKKKYKDDPAKLQSEQLRLMREAGASPLGMLGCLPMFLQMPIWTALYAMLFYAIELRHEPAFWGVFQTVSGGNWRFLADLSGPDNFILFGGDGLTIPLYFIEPHFNAINILPILMAIVFFINNLLMSPPPANEQQASMQRTMRIMFLIFPLFLYSAPAGLTLYMTSSTAAGILDSWIVRRHLKHEEESGRLFEKKKPKPGGFWDRIHKAMEQAQQQVEAQRAAKEGGRKHVQNEANQPGGRAAARRMKRK